VFVRLFVLLTCCADCVYVQEKVFVTMSQADVYKVVFLGNKGVGIHSLLCRLTGNEVVRYDRSIPGGDSAAEYKTRVINVNGKDAEFRFYETQGQEEFRGSLTSSYFRHSCGIIYAYDETDLQSFEDVRKSYLEASKFASDGSMQFLIGNKNDLVDQGTPRAVQNEMAEDLANTFMTNPMHVSAATGAGCEEAFQYISGLLIQHGKSSKRGVNFGNDDGPTDTVPKKSTPKRKCWC